MESLLDHLHDEPPRYRSPRDVCNRRLSQKWRENLRHNWLLDSLRVWLDEAAMSFVAATLPDNYADRDGYTVVKGLILWMRTTLLSALHRRNATRCA